MKIFLLSSTHNPEILIESAGRICTGTTSECNIEKARRFVKKRIEEKHFSILEHASATFKISGISRACSHQLVRHRMASYSQQSQRYVKQDGFEYVVPESIRENEASRMMYRDFMAETQALYAYLISLGVKPEDARFILPNACKTEIIVTMNFRAWREFLEKRLDSSAQWEIRELAEKILNDLCIIAPSVFEDLKK